MSNIAPVHSSGKPRLLPSRQLPHREPERSMPAPIPKALDLQARIRRRGVRLADLSTAADRRALLNGLARGALVHTADSTGNAVVVGSAKI